MDALRRVPIWQPDVSFRPPGRAEHGFIDGFELLAFDLPGYKDDPRVIGWEVFGGDDFLTMVTKGTCATLEDAKAAAEAALANLPDDPQGKDGAR
jgi:hypothetical protein